jgi:hypothetical protein
VSGTARGWNLTGGLAGKCSKPFQVGEQEFSADGGMQVDICCEKRSRRETEVSKFDWKQRNEIGPPAEVNRAGGFAGFVRFVISIQAVSYR